MAEPTVTPGNPARSATGLGATIQRDGVPQLVPVVSDPDFELFVGDARDTLWRLRDESVDCCLTSPPFFQQRDYDFEGQIGQESDVREWADALVEVFREARRALTPEGTLWVEVGDKYLKKELQLAPFHLALALQADGWVARQVNIWHKPDAIPESAKDRCTTAHSYVLHFAKTRRSFFDAEAILEPAEWAKWGAHTTRKYEGTQTSTGWMKPKSKAELAPLARRSPLVPEQTKQGVGTQGAGSATFGLFPESGKRHPRSVWHICTSEYPGAHFAVMPPELAEQVLKAACPPGGVVLDPFLGSGTTALVARQLGLRCVGVEGNPEYAAQAAARLGQQSLLAAT